MTKMPAYNWRFNFVELAGSVAASGVTALRITPPAALAAGNEQSGKMARKTCGGDSALYNKIVN